MAKVFILNIFKTEGNREGFKRLRYVLRVYIWRKEF